MESEEFQREMKEACPSFSADKIKKPISQFGSDVSVMADQIFAMREIARKIVESSDSQPLEA